MRLEAGMKLGKYELRRKLGEGGFGLVFLGFDTELEREVALKFMHPEHTANTEILKRFLQEARSAARIAHPGIVTVFECGQVANTATDADGMAYIAMELLHGESLADRLARVRRLPWASATEIARQVALALEAAHRAGIIHRDLKPDNIFLVTDAAMPGGERVKVLDFGIAKLAQQPADGGVQTHSQVVFGTPRYMSPEQCRSAANIDPRSDIYTLGCILLELVTGATPFDGELGEQIANHLMVAPPRARERNPDVPLHVDELIDRMLAKEPGDRPQTMAALARALEQASTGNALSAGIAPTLAPIAAASHSEPVVMASPTPGLAPPARAALATTLASTSMASAVVAAAPRSRTRMIAVGAVAAIAIAGAGWVVATRSSSDGREATAPGSSLPPAPPPTRPAVADVALELDASPAAEVYLMPDSRLLGTTPYRTHHPAAEGSLVYVLKAAGYEDVRVVVPADKDAKQTIALVPRVPPTGAGSALAAKPAKPAKPPPGLPTRPPKAPGTPTPGSAGAHIPVYED